jgi:CRISPR-associated endonuclease/helicase Cas3
MVELTDILLDAWSMTSIRTRMPGRPDVEPYLHGISDYEEPETHVAWREEVGVITADMFAEYPPQDLLELYPLKPHELLRDQSKRVFKELQSLTEHFGDRPVWLVDDYGMVDATHTLSSLTARDESPIKGKTVLLPHDVGGLSDQGMLDGTAQRPSSNSDHTQTINNDVADHWFDPDGNRLRIRVDNCDDGGAAGMRRRHTIKWPDAEDGETDDEPRKWFWFEKPILTENSRHSLHPVLLDVHTKDVETRVNAILKGLPLEPWIANVLRLAAKWHDLGKCRDHWQACIGRPDKWKETWFAKSGREWVARRDGSYRHEFGSVLDVTQLGEFEQLDARMQDLVLHLIATHHGMARPHFEEKQTIDTKHAGEFPGAMSIESVRRFARLQHTFGHWGLAYVESILRAADWHASATPSAYFEEATR